MIKKKNKLQDCESVFIVLQCYSNLTSTQKTRNFKVNKYNAFIFMYLFYICVCAHTHTHTHTHTDTDLNTSKRQEKGYYYLIKRKAKVWTVQNTL